MLLNIFKKANIKTDQRVTFKIKSSLSDTGWQEMWLHIGSGKGMFPDSTKPSHKAMLTRHQGVCGIHIRAISNKILMISICKMTLKINFFKLQLHLPGPNELRGKGNFVIFFNYQTMISKSHMTKSWNLNSHHYVFSGWSHWNHNKMVAVLQMPFSWKKMLVFWYKFHWISLLRAHWSISEHWSR